MNVPKPVPVLADLDAEIVTLGTLFLAPDDPAVLATVRRILPDPAAFSDVRHRAIYRAIGELAEEGAVADFPSVRNRLAVHHASVEISDDYLADLFGAAATTANLEWHAKAVRDRWQRRQVVEQATAAITLAQDLKAPVGLTIAGTVERLGQAHAVQRRGSLAPRDAAWEVLQDLEEQAGRESHLVGVGCGLEAVDRLTAGWEPGHLWVVGARPSTGKTSFVVDAALAATDAGPVLFCTAEMPARGIYRRMIARLSGQNLREVRSPESWRLMLPHFRRGAELLAQLPLRVDDTCVTPADIRAAVAQWTAELGQPPALVVVDYLGKLSAGRRAENRNVEVGYISTALARIAVDSDVPMLCAHQLNRANVRDGKPRHPTMADLRDSGSVEQDAHGIILLHSPPDQPVNTPGLHTVHTRVIVEKNRDGETGLVHAWHDKATGTWSEMSFHDRRELAAA